MSTLNQSRILGGRAMEMTQEDDGEDHEWKEISRNGAPLSIWQLIVE